MDRLDYVSMLSNEVCYVEALEGTTVLVVCTSVDVIHSWTVPALGIKVLSTSSEVDAIEVLGFRRPR